MKFIFLASIDWKARFGYFFEGKLSREKLIISLELSIPKKRAVMDNQPFKVEYRLRHKDGDIRYFLTLQIAGRLDKDADEFIALIVDGAARMQRMIDDLLAYSRVGTCGNPFESTNLEDIFNQAGYYMV